MKKLGIVGGIGPESTIEYYRFAFAEYRARVRDGSAPPIVIDSIDVNHMLGLIGDGRLPDVTEYLARAVHNLVKSGAEIGLLAAHTPHIVFDAIARRSSIPLISIVETACDAVVAKGMTRVGLFGTRFTMSGRFYPEVFSRQGITIVSPRPNEQEEIHRRYTTELVQGRVVPETRARLLEIARRLRDEEGAEAIILAGTELPMALRDAGDPTLEFLDATAIHVRVAIERMLER